MFILEEIIFQRCSAYILLSIGLEFGMGLTTKSFQQKERRRKGETMNQQQTRTLTVAVIIISMVVRTNILGMPSIANTKAGHGSIANLLTRLARNGPSSWPRHLTTIDSQFAVDRHNDWQR
jgi:hypothetical protein